MRLRRNLTLSAGMRYEAQTHVGDYDGLMPRVGVTWAPFKSGATTLRSSWGIFHDWLQPAPTSRRCAWTASTSAKWICSTRRIPTSATSAPAPPANRYLLDGGLRLPRTNRASVGVDQRLAPAGADQRPPTPTSAGRRCIAGSNLNAPVDGVRPDRGSATSSRWCRTRASRQHEVQFAMTVNPGALLPAFNAPLINWKRITVFANYTWANLEEQFRRRVRDARDRQPGARVGQRALRTCRTGSTSRSTTRSSGTCWRR